jgi:hypothetical protein
MYGRLTLTLNDDLVKHGSQDRFFKRTGASG